MFFIPDICTQITPFSKICPLLKFVKFTKKHLKHPATIQTAV